MTVFFQANIQAGQLQLFQGGISDFFCHSKKNLRAGMREKFFKTIFCEFSVKFYFFFHTNGGRYPSIPPSIAALYPGLSPCRQDFFPEGGESRGFLYNFGKGQWGEKIEVLAQNLLFRIFNLINAFKLVAFLRTWVFYNFGMGGLI